MNEGWEVIKINSRGVVHTSGCINCPLRDGDYCNVGHYLKSYQYDKYPDWCPLITNQITVELI